ncbi:MAG: SDR family NAD(P)-dependent oxidoreductase [Lachnospiraceae bacterium]|nr:SDR family NAD(P)-dependent oxidoreductase [Lachnospiraceae bacterium]
MDKTALITGASSDLGIAYIQENITEYTRIIAHYNRKNESFEALLEAYGDKIVPIQADFIRREEVERLIQEVKEQNLAPDHILHLVSIPAKSVRFHKSEIGEYEAMMEVSFYSIVEILKAFLPAMQKQKYGRILFLLSAYTTIPDPKYAAPYVASKYALLGLMKAVSAEYAAKGITVNGISPQMIETKFLKDVPELIVEQHKKVSPLGRLLQKTDILPVMKLLLSDEAAAITGENISITGGNYIL